MCRPIAKETEVARCADYALAESMVPNAIHQNARSQRMAAGRQGAGEGEPAAGRRQRGVPGSDLAEVERFENCQVGRGDGVFGSFNVAALEKKRRRRWTGDFGQSA